MKYKPTGKCEIPIFCRGRASSALWELGRASSAHVDLGRASSTPTFADDIVGLDFFAEANYQCVCGIGCMALNGLAV